MPVRPHLSGYRWYDSLQHSAVRTGLYSGLCLSAVLIGWILVANRVPFLEKLALERNISAAALLGAIALVPVLRFRRHPRRLLLAGLTAWTVCSFVYRLLCLFFAGLPDRMSAFHVFVLGSIGYSIVATLSWIGTSILAVRNHQAPNSEQHLS